MISEIIKTMLNELGPIVAMGIFGIVVKSIKPVGNAAIELLLKKKEQAEQVIQSNNQQDNLNKAFDVWKIVDDKFRLTENALELFGSKAKLFEQILLKKIPGLTQDDIDDLRDTVSGEVNKGKAAITSNDTDSELAKLRDENKQLQEDNANKQKQLDQIASAFNNINIPQVNNNVVDNTPSDTEASVDPNLNANQ